MNYKVKLLLTIVCFVLLVNIFTACESASKSREITVILVNATNDEWHLLIGHDTSLNAGNKVAPGASKGYRAVVDTQHVVENRYKFNDSVRCVAGKNGSIIKTSRVGLIGDTTDTVTIIWNGSSFKVKY